VQCCRVPEESNFIVLPLHQHCNMLRTNIATPLHTIMTTRLSDSGELNPNLDPYTVPKTFEMLPLEWKEAMQKRAHPARFSVLKASADFEQEVKEFVLFLDPKPHLA
jgi:hypothetical protein